MDFSQYINQDEALQLLCDLVAIDSTCPGLVPNGAGEIEIARFIEQWLTAEGFPAEVRELGGTRANVLGWLKGAPGGRRLMLNGHIDTVGAEGMTIEPFRAKVEGNRVYGLGAGDMKCGVVSALLAMKAIKQAGVALKGEILFTGVADEEYLSIGTEDIARNYTAAGAVITEPSGGSITVTHKGFVWLDVEVYGQAAHGSDPVHGVDAIVQTAKFLLAMDEFEKSDLFKRPHHPLLTPPSIHASLIDGGKELSTYPDYCKVSLERRTIPGETAASCLAEIEGIIAALHAKDPRFQAKCTVTFERNPLPFVESPLLRELSAVIETVTGAKPVLTGGSGWCDTALLQPVGIPALVYGPKCVGAHAAVEYTELDSIVQATEVLARLAVAFCGTE